MHFSVHLSYFMKSDIPIQNMSIKYLCYVQLVIYRPVNFIFSLWIFVYTHTIWRPFKHKKEMTKKIKQLQSRDCVSIQGSRSKAEAGIKKANDLSLVGSGFGIHIFLFRPGRWKIRAVKP